MEYNISDFPPVCGMTHLNTVPEEMGFCSFFETGNLINWYWISGVQANVGGQWMGLLSKQPPGGRGHSEEGTEAFWPVSTEGFAL